MLSNLIADAPESNLNLVTLGMTLAAGLTLFLFGMDQMTSGLKMIAGRRMTSLLAKMTDGRVRGVFSGAFITAVIQSSSVTTVLVVGLVAAGLMRFEQSIAVIMGANIGTTITAQVVAFQVTYIAPLLIAAGFGLMSLARSDSWKFWGEGIMGLGLVFFGIDLMSDGTVPLRNNPWFVEFLGTLQNPILGILAAAVFTGIVQSSSATTGIVVMLAAQGLVTLEMGIAMAFGANIGTCVTAMLSTIGRPREAVRAGLVHVVFNLVGVAVWIGLVDQLAWIVRELSPSYPDLAGSERLAAEVPRQIANAHTIFNVANTVFFIGFTGVFARFVQRLVPEASKESANDERLQGMLELVAQPDLALVAARREIGTLAGASLAMARDAGDTILEGDRRKIEELRNRDDEVDRLHEQLVHFLSQLSRETLSDAQSNQVADLLSAGQYFESVGDIVATSMSEAGFRRNERQVHVGKDTSDLIQLLHARVIDTLECALRAAVHQDVDQAKEVVTAKPELSRLASDIEAHLRTRLKVDEPLRTDTFRIEADLIESYRRLYYYAKRVAKITLSAAASRKSPKGDGEATDDRETDATFDVGAKAGAETASTS